jgi:hypothetical protein
MYHPLAMDQIRIQQEELRRRTAAVHWTSQTVKSRPRSRRWPRPTRSLLLRLAFTDTAMRPTRSAAADC